MIIQISLNLKWLHLAKKAYFTHSYRQNQNLDICGGQNWQYFECWTFCLELAHYMFQKINKVLIFKMVREKKMHKRLSRCHLDWWELWKKCLWIMRYSLTLQKALTCCLFSKVRISASSLTFRLSFSIVNLPIPLFIGVTENSSHFIWHESFMKLKWFAKFVKYFVKKSWNLIQFYQKVRLLHTPTNYSQYWFSNQWIGKFAKFG